jgi:hypothetical protein
MRMAGSSRSTTRWRRSGLGRLDSFTRRHPNGRNRAQTRCQGQPLRTAGSGGYLPLAPGISTVRYPIPQRTFKYAATVQSVTDETCQFRTLLATRHRLHVLRTVGVEPACGVDFRWRHIACDIAHLLADVVPPGAGGEGLQLAA